MKTRILLGDEEGLVRDSVRQALQATGRFEIVAEASSPEQIGPLVRRARPQLLLIDPHMRNGHGFAGLAAARKAAPALPAIVLAHDSDPEQIAAAARLGASGYILKSVLPHDLPALVHAVASGNVAFLGDGRAAALVVESPHGLSERELEILRSVARGLTNEAIGRELWVSEQTVKFHLRNIFRKLGVANRTEATKFAFRHGYAA